MDFPNIDFAGILLKFHWKNLNVKIKWNWPQIMVLFCKEIQSKSLLIWCSHGFVEKGAPCILKKKTSKPLPLHCMEQKWQHLAEISHCFITILFYLHYKVCNRTELLTIYEQNVFCVEFSLSLCRIRYMHK